MENVVYDYPQDIIANGETKTFQYYECYKYNSLIFSLKTDKSGICYVDFSIDGSNWDSTLTYQVAAGLNEVHKLTVTRKYFRIRFYNDSGEDQTYFRLQTILGEHTILTSNINNQVQNDADATITRPIDFNLLLAEGLYQNRTITIKDGLTGSMGNGTVTEDLWSQGSAYTGFPTAATEEGQINVAGADTGTVYYAYLESSTSTDYVFGSKAIAGAGTYDLGHNIYRCNFAYFVSSSATAFNAGLITIRWKTTTTVIFCAIQAGLSQSYCGAYTVPYGSSVYIDRFNGNMRGSANGSVEGFVWYRPLNESPRLRFPFELQFGSLFFDDVDYLVKVPQQVDFIPRITTTSTNGLRAKFSYRILKVKQ